MKKKLFKVSTLALSFVISSYVFAGNCDPGDYCGICGDDYCIFCYPDGHCDIFPQDTII